MSISTPAASGWARVAQQIRQGRVRPDLAGLALQRKAVATVQDDGAPVETRLEAAKVVCEILGWGKAGG